MRLRASAYSTHTFLGIEFNANATDVPDNVHTIQECDSRRFHLLIVVRSIH